MAETASSPEPRTAGVLAALRHSIVAAPLRACFAPRQTVAHFFHHAAFFDYFLAAAVGASVAAVGGLLVGLAEHVLLADLDHIIESLAVGDVAQATETTRGALEAGAVSTGLALEALFLAALFAGLLAFQRSVACLPFARTVQLTFAAAICLLGPLAVMLLFLGVTETLIDQLYRIRFARLDARDHAGGDIYYALSELAVVSITALIAATGLLWVLRAVSFIRERDDLDPDAFPPRCEHCGYDLRYAPLDARCSECGRPVADSLVPDRARPGIPWEAHMNPRTFLHTLAHVTARPKHFYQTIRGRGTTAHSLYFALGSITLSVLVGFLILELGLRAVPLALGFPWRSMTAPATHAGYALFASLAMAGVWLGCSLLTLLLSARRPQRRNLAKLCDYELALLIPIMVAVTTLFGPVVLLFEATNPSIATMIFTALAIFLAAPVLLAALFLYRMRVILKATAHANF